MTTLTNKTLLIGENYKKGGFREKKTDSVGVLVVARGYSRAQWLGAGATHCIWCASLGPALPVNLVFSALV